MQQLINVRYQADLIDEGIDFNVAHTRFLRFRSALLQEAELLDEPENRISANAYITNPHNDMPLHIEVIIRLRAESFREVYAVVNRLMANTEKRAGIRIEDSDTPEFFSDDVYSVDSLEFAGS